MFVHIISLFSNRFYARSKPNGRPIKTAATTLSSVGINEASRERINRFWPIFYFRECKLGQLYRTHDVRSFFLIYLNKCFKYRVRQKYLTIWQHSCEWNLWLGEFVLAPPSSETQSISIAMERLSVEHRAFAVEMYF